jgi:hypothetical protein
VFFTTPYALLLSSKFTVSSRELAEQILGDEKNYLPKGKSLQVIGILNRQVSKALHFRFVAITLDSYKIEKRSGQFELEVAQKITTSPRLKNSTEAADYLKKSIQTLPRVLYLALLLESVSSAKDKK